MGDNSWDEVLERQRHRTLAGPGANQMPPHAVEGEAKLPVWDTPYKAVAQQDNGTLTRLACIMGKEGYQPGGRAYRFFQYVHLDSNTHLGFDANGHVMTLRFVGTEPATIIVRGRNLLRACDYIHLHRIAWIRASDPERDFAFLDEERGKKMEIITSIEIIPAAVDLRR
jgi:hypothetical protein